MPGRPVVACSGPGHVAKLTEKEGLNWMTELRFHLGPVKPMEAGRGDGRIVLMVGKDLVPGSLSVPSSP